ncbi:MAG: VTT domain-containing protein [Aquimonas sp.]|nr:VTT domain-containing protein [Aquimonas sp.]
MSSRSTDPTRRVRHRGADALKVLAALLLVALLVLLWSRWDQEAFIAWKQQVGVLPFFALMAVLPALGVPITPFFIVAGATFGFATGLSGSLIALAANLSLSYWLAQTGLRRPALRLAQRFDMRLPDFDGRRDRALGFILLVRVTPGPPAMVKNFLLGIAAVPFGLYLGVSMLVGGVYGLSFVVLGESALEGDPRKLGLGLVCLLLAAAVAWALRKKMLR